MAVHFSAGVENSASEELRRDIQALRGIAVLVVVLYHYGFGGFARGYLGVDVFFVISGFLISRQIMLLRLAGRFTLGDFYLRRARRLLPALYAMLAVVAAWMLAFASYSDWQAFGNQLRGAVVYCANFVFWQEGGYFGGDARLKPLLHLWSLALEEQYYLLLPLLLVVVQARFWFVSLAALLMLSALACSMLQETAPDATFYLLPMRAWELLVGSLLAWTMLPQHPELAMRIRAIVGSLALPSAALALGALVVGYGTDHPGLDAAVVVVATAVLIAARPGWLNRGPLVALLARCGDISYSLYLVHWPIHALALSANLTRPLGWRYRLGLLAVALLLAVLSYRLVEQPLRRPKSGNRAFLIGIAMVSAVLLTLPWARPSPHAGEVDWVQVNRGANGFGWQCDFSDAYVDLAECRNGRDPAMLLWGDSTAMHWVTGLAARGFEFRQATKSVCAPVVGIAPVFEKYGETWARRCVAFNASVMQHLVRSGSGERVILMAATFRGFSESVFNDDRTVPADPERVARAFVATIDALQTAGKVVVLIAPPPSIGVDLARCVDQAARGRHQADELLAADCSFAQADAERHDAAAMKLVRDIAGRAGVDVLWPADFLCDSGRCASARSGVPIYRDGLHLSHPGSELVVRGLEFRLRSFIDTR